MKEHPNQETRNQNENLENLKKLYEQEPEVWGIRLADCYIARGESFTEHAEKEPAKKTNYLKNAEEDFEKALEIYRPLTEKDVLKYGQTAAETYKALAAVYFALDCPEDGLVLWNEAIYIYGRLTECDPVLYRKEKTKAETQLFIHSMAIRKEQERRKEEKLKTIRHLNKQAGFSQKGQVLEKRKTLEKALVLCDELEKQNVSTIDQADVYCSYGSLVSGDKQIEYLEKGWGIYAAYFQENPRYCLVAMNRVLILLIRRFRKDRHPEWGLAYGEQLKELCDEFSLTDGRTGLDLLELSESYGLMGVVCRDIRQLSDAQEAFQKTIELALEADKADPVRRKKVIKKAEHSLRNLYLNPSRHLRDTYTDEDLDHIMKEMKVSKPRSIAGRFKSATEDKKRLAIARAFSHAGQQKSKKDIREAEYCFQMAKLLLVELEQKEAGSFTQELQGIEEKIKENHIRLDQK